jgi:DNA-binding XRE family transcriptional regulator
MDPKNEVRKFRTGKNLTQEELASEVRLRRQTIIAIEEGGRPPWWRWH